MTKVLIKSKTKNVGVFPLILVCLQKIAIAFHLQDGIS
jgi:hypothetical protein